jgi:NifU-like protein involved in Fe-S cluster formation
MSEVVDLLKKSGYSDKAIEYYLNKLNVGEIEDHSSHFMYTGPCGDSMAIFLKVDSGVINDAKFQAVGCAGAFASGSALTEMIKGKTLEEAERLDERDIVSHLGGIPEPKIHCACLAKTTLGLAIEDYRQRRVEERSRQ